MNAAVRPRNHGRNGARPAARPSDPSPTAASRGGPMQHAEASMPATSEPANALRCFMTPASSCLQVVARVLPEPPGARLAAGHVVRAGDPDARTVSVDREDD